MRRMIFLPHSLASASVPDGGHCLSLASRPGGSVPAVPGSYPVMVALPVAIVTLPLCFPLCFAFS